MTRFAVASVALGLAGTCGYGVVPPAPRLPAAALTPAEKPADPAEKPADDPAALADRITKNAKEAGDKLADRDPGDDTRKTQEQILKDIDELLKKAQNPPPNGGGGGGGGDQNDAGKPPPMGGGGGPGGGQDQGGGKPQGGGSQQAGGGGAGSKPSRGGWRERRQQEQQAGAGGQKPGGSDPAGKGPGRAGPGGKDPKPQAGGGDPTKPGGGPGGGGNGGKSKPDRPLDDAITKQVWGHLPERLRQQMSQYYQEQFMPRYGDLLRQYYSSLAEREKAPRKP